MHTHLLERFGSSKLRRHVHAQTNVLLLCQSKLLRTKSRSVSARLSALSRSRWLVAYVAVIQGAGSSETHRAVGRGVAERRGPHRGGHGAHCAALPPVGGVRQSPRRHCQVSQDMLHTSHLCPGMPPPRAAVNARVSHSGQIGPIAAAGSYHSAACEGISKLTRNHGATCSLTW